MPRRAGVEFTDDEDGKLRTGWNQALFEGAVKAYQEERYTEALDTFDEYLGYLPDDPTGQKYIQCYHEALLNVSFAA